MRRLENSETGETVNRCVVCDAAAPGAGGVGGAGGSGAGPCGGGRARRVRSRCGSRAAAAHDAAGSRHEASVRPPLALSRRARVPRGRPRVLGAGGSHCRPVDDNSAEDLESPTERSLNEVVLPGKVSKVTFCSSSHGTAGQIIKLKNMYLSPQGFLRWQVIKKDQHIVRVLHRLRHINMQTCMYCFLGRIYFPQHCTCAHGPRAFGPHPQAK